MALNQEYEGACECFTDHPHERGTLHVAIPCRIAHSQEANQALLDTAAEWCMLPAGVAERIGLDLTSDPGTVRVETRLGFFSGRLERLTLTLIATEGQAVDIDATFFICREWQGPIVVGWKGCLERIRFGLDPSAEKCRFFFASV